MLDKIYQANEKTPEREIEASYYQHSVEKNYHEWGARVHGAMDRVTYFDNMYTHWKLILFPIFVQ